MTDSTTTAKDAIQDKRRKYEIAAVLLTGVGKIVFMDVLQWRLIFILIAITGWTSYVVYRHSTVNGILRYWGFRFDNFRDVAWRILPFGMVAVVSFFLIGYRLDTLNVTWHIIPILILYPVWGVIQQFLVIGLVAGNLQDLRSIRLHRSIIILSTASLFGLVHYPYWWLVTGTFVLALLYGSIYLKARNVYVMGLFHGWLGALFFYTVVGRDPFAEVFGKIIQ
jgi:uncharacterized protein